MEFYSKEIYHKLYNKLKEVKEIHGIVHSVFNRVCNISSEGWPIISLIFESIPMKPMAISFNAPGNKSMNDLGIDIGQRVIYYEGKLRIPEADFILEINSPKLVECRHSFDLQVRSKREVEVKISELRIILFEGNTRGLLPIISEFDSSAEDKYNKITHNPYSEFAWPRVNKLNSSIRKGDFEEIYSSSRDIAGFGPGLTPSADDMLMGLMISLIYAEHYFNWREGYAEAVNSAILKGAEGKTNQLSFEMMGFAAQGEVTENIHQLMKCVYFKSESELWQSALDVMDYGETSGSDLILGIYIGCRICMDLNQ